MRQVFDTSVKGLRSLGAAEKASAEGDVREEKRREGKPEQDGEKEFDDAEGEGSFLHKVLGRGTLAAKALGKYAVCWRWRRKLPEKTLATAVLKRTSRSLRAVVESMNDNKSFPVVYEGPYFLIFGSRIQDSHFSWCHY
jgi:hypothetical protein